MKKSVSYYIGKFYVGYLNMWNDVSDLEFRLFGVGEGFFWVVIFKLRFGWWEGGSYVSMKR